MQRNIAAEHQRFLACLPRDKHDELVAELRDFPAFTRSVLGWEAADLIGLDGNEPLPAELEVAIPGYNETLRPTYAVREFRPRDADRPWMMLIKRLPVGEPLDALASDSDSHWQATPQSKFERLLRETQVPLAHVMQINQRTMWAMLSGRRPISRRIRRYFRWAIGLTYTRDHEPWRESPEAMTPLPCTPAVAAILSRQRLSAADARDVADYLDCSTRSTFNGECAPAAIGLDSVVRGLRRIAAWGRGSFSNCVPRSASTGRKAVRHDASPRRRSPNPPRLACVRWLPVCWPVAAVGG